MLSIWQRALVSEEQREERENEARVPRLRCRHPRQPRRRNPGALRRSELSAASGRIGALSSGERRGSPPLQLRPKILPADTRGGGASRELHRARVKLAGRQAAPAGGAG